MLERGIRRISYSIKLFWSFDSKSTVLKFSECIDYFMLTETSFKFLDLAGLSTSEQSGLVQTNINKMLSFIWALFVQANDMKYFTQSFTDYGLQNIGCQTVQNVLPILQQVIT